jgi:hypothetical protein
MERFPVHTLDSAPEASKSALRDVQTRFGMIPNLAGAMATSPVLIQSFIEIFDKVHVGSSPSDARLGALSTVARTLIEKRGRLEDQDTERFISAGFGKDLLLEVITIVAASTITNYTGNVTNPPLEAMLQPHRWES